MMKAPPEGASERTLIDWLEKLHADKPPASPAELDVFCALYGFTYQTREELTRIYHRYHGGGREFTPFFTRRPMDYIIDFFKAVGRI